MVPGTPNALYNKLNYRNDFFAFRGISNLGTALPSLGREGLVWLERRKSRRPSLSPLPPPLGKGGEKKGDSHECIRKQEERKGDIGNGNSGEGEDWVEEKERKESSRKALPNQEDPL